MGGLLIALFVGWVWTKGAKEEVTNNGTHPFPQYSVWLWICRIVAPVCIGFIFINGLKW